MNEERIARILLELRRIGVDLSTFDEGLVGTGLRASELAEWLRAIPDGAGVDELQRRLDERSRESRPPVEYRWKKEPPHSPTLERRERWWPTQALLDAGTDLLEEEWDPFGIRLAGADREQIAMFAFHFFGPLLAPNAYADPIGSTTIMIASAEHDLALRPSPEPHRRYLAGRLRELVERHPLPEPAYQSHQPTNVVQLGPIAGPPALDPEGVCARCRAFGTVARVTTEAVPAARTLRYCRACWAIVRGEFTGLGRIPKKPETAAEHVAFIDAIHQAPRTTESRSWLDTMDFVRLMTDAGARVADDPKQSKTLARAAADIMAMDDKMDGPMPPEVEAFVQRYWAPDA